MLQDPTRNARAHRPQKRTLWQNQFEEDEAAERELADEYDDVMYCMQCHEFEVAPSQQLCDFCIRKSIRRAGAPRGMYH